MTTPRTAALATAAAAALLAATGTAVAHADNVVPGADTSGRVVIVDSGALTVTVAPAGAAATEITGTVANTGTTPFTCAGPSAADPTAGDVSDAGTVAAAMEYYRTQLYRQAPQLPLEFDTGIPFVGTIKLGTLDFGSAGGSLDQAGSLTGPAAGARKDIATSHAAARQAGHTGLVPALATVAPGQTVPFTAPLGLPSSGARTDFDAAVFLLCTEPSDTAAPGQAYAFAGYEKGAPAPSAPAAGGGSLGTGSLGSTGAGSTGR